MTGIAGNKAAAENKARGLRYATTYADELRMKLSYRKPPNFPALLAIFRVANESFCRFLFFFFILLGMRSAADSGLQQTGKLQHPAHMAW